MDPRFSDETLSFLNLFMQAPPPTEKKFDVCANRDIAEAVHAKINQMLVGTFKGTEEEKLIKTNSAEIPVTVYTPTHVDKSKLVIFFHGGGWTLCSRKTHQTMVNMLADATKTIWISVEYRLGPEYKFPIWWNDVYEVTQYILVNKQSYGVDSSAKVGVAGESCGSTMSAALCHALKEIEFQILVYGIYDLARTAPSYKEFVHDMYFLTPETLDWLTSTAFDNLEDAMDKRVSVIHNNTFEGLPPCLFIVAELDPLRDDSYAYKKLLDEAGVKTELVVVKGVIHGFFSLPGTYLRASSEVIKATQQFLATL